MDLKVIANDFFSKYRFDKQVYYLVDNGMFVKPDIINDFKEKKKVLMKKIPINQYKFDVEIIDETVEPIVSEETKEPIVSEETKVEKPIKKIKK